MKVVEVTELGGPDVLEVADREEPEAGPGQVVVRVRAANINPTDLGARQGLGRHTPPDPPFVLGWDLAGKVIAVGEGVTDLSEGDRVVGMVQWYDQAWLGRHLCGVGRLRRRLARPPPRRARLRDRRDDPAQRGDREGGAGVARRARWL